MQDHVLRVEEFPVPDGGTLLADYTRSVGGVAANTATGLARLGINVVMGTSVGRDSSGVSITRAMKAEGVSVLGVSEKAVSSASYVVVDSSNKTRRWFAYLGSLLDATWQDAWAEVLQASMLLFVDGQPARLTLGGLWAASELGIRTALDISSEEYFYSVGWTREDLFRVIGEVDMLLPSVAAARSLAGTEDAESACRMLSSICGGEVVVTEGQYGAVVGGKSEGWRIAAPDVEPVDTTGAGDAFHAGYIFGRLAGETTVRSGCIGSQVAGSAVRAVGGQTGLPYLRDLDRVATPDVVRLW